MAVLVSFGAQMEHSNKAIF